MKKHAETLDNNCMMFLTSSSHIRTNLKAIPSEPSDKNYVDKWLSDQLTEFKSSNPGSNIFGSVLNVFKLKFTQDEQDCLTTNKISLENLSVGCDVLQLKQPLDEINNID